MSMCRRYFVNSPASFFSAAVLVICHPQTRPPLRPLLALVFRLVVFDVHHLSHALMSK